MRLVTKPFEMGKGIASIGIAGAERSVGSISLGASGVGRAKGSAIIVGASASFCPLITGAGNGGAAVPTAAGCAAMETVLEDATAGSGGILDGVATVFGGGGGKRGRAATGAAGAPGRAATEDGGATP